MSDQENLPAKINKNGIALPEDQSNNLVMRGLEAIKNAQKQLPISIKKDDNEESFQKTYWDAYEREDYETAFHLLYPKAEHGDPWAQCQIAIGHMSFGRGIEYNAVEIAKWYRKSAEQGYAHAQYNLGTMYMSGNRGVYGNNKEGIFPVLDYVQAYKWFSLAEKCSQYDEKQAAIKDGAARICGELAAKMTKEKLAEAKRLVSEWKPK